MKKLLFVMILDLVLSILAVSQAMEPVSHVPHEVSPASR